LNHIYSRTAAALAAVAITEAFPGSEFIEGGETSRGFYCQFVAPFLLPPVALDLLEERMRQIVRENRPIRDVEMVSQCAKELFKKSGQKAAVAAMNECGPKDLVPLVQIGEFYEIMAGPFCPSIRDVGAFKVVHLNFLGEKEYRIEGCAFATKAELKEYVRKLSKYEYGNHLIVGQRLGLWEQSDGLLWKGRGLAAKRGLVSFFRKSLVGEELATNNLNCLKKYAMKRVAPGVPFFAWIFIEKSTDSEGEEGLFNEGCQSLVEQKIYCCQGEMQSLLISLLQTIDKTLIILGFHTSFRLAGRKKGEKTLKILEAAFGKELSIELDGLPGARAQWIVLDGLGREQIAAEIELIEETTVQVKVGIEKILALLLEQTDGNLPNWLISER